jgi:hypothetical protein
VSLRATTSLRSGQAPGAKQSLPRKKKGIASPAPARPPVGPGSLRSPGPSCARAIPLLPSRLTGREEGDSMPLSGAKGERWDGMVNGTHPYRRGMGRRRGNGQAKRKGSTSMEAGWSGAWQVPDHINEKGEEGGKGILRGRNPIVLLEPVGSRLPGAASQSLPRRDRRRGRRRRRR